MTDLLEFVLDLILHIYRPAQPNNGRKSWINALIGYLKLFGVLVLIVGILALIIGGVWALFSTLPSA